MLLLSFVRLFASATVPFTIQPRHGARGRTSHDSGRDVIGLSPLPRSGRGLRPSGSGTCSYCCHLAAVQCTAERGAADVAGRADGEPDGGTGVGSVNVGRGDGGVCVLSF